MELKKIFFSAVEEVEDQLMPHKIKIEWNYLPDLLIEVDRRNLASGKESSLLSILHPKVFLKGRSYEIGFDLKEKKKISPNSATFKKGKFQEFLTSQRGKLLLFLFSFFLLKKLLGR